MGTFPELFRRDITPGTNDCLALYFMLRGALYLRPEGSNSKSRYRGWLGSKMILWALQRALTLKISSRPVCLTPSTPCQGSVCWLFFCLQHNPALHSGTETHSGLLLRWGAGFVAVGLPEPTLTASQNRSPCVGYMQALLRDVFCPHSCTSCTLIVVLVPILTDTSLSSLMTLPWSACCMMTRNIMARS